MFNIINDEEMNLLREKLILLQISKNLIKNNLFNNKLFILDNNTKNKEINIGLNSFYGFGDDVDCIDNAIFDFLETFIGSNLKFFNIIAGGQQEIDDKKESDEIYEYAVYDLDEINSDLKDYSIEPLQFGVYTEFVYIGYYFILKNDLLKQYMDKYNDLKSLESKLGNNMFPVSGYYYYDPYNESLDINVGYKNDGSILILVGMDISVVSVIDAIMKMFNFIHEKLNEEGDEANVRCSITC